MAKDAETKVIRTIGLFDGTLCQLLEGGIVRLTVCEDREHVFLDLHDLQRQWTGALPPPSLAR